MIVTYKWLKEYVDIDLTPSELAEKLTMAGLEVEGLEKHGDDTVLHINLTPNRADSLSIIGCARESAIAGETSLKLPRFSVKEFAPSKRKADIAIEAPDLCARYSGLIIENITIKDSPSEIREKLERCGVRAINNIVDATNYVLLETGHPQHAFDLHLLAGEKIIVRRAGKSEKIKTLDGEEHQLTHDDLVIADAKQPVALAGIMGGFNSEIKTGTKDILLESAWFEPVSIRRTSRRLRLHTEASHRFERGADPMMTVNALLRTAEIILRQCPEARVSAVTDAIGRKIKPTHLKYRNARYEKIIGTSVKFPAAVSILKKIGCEVDDRDNEAQICKVTIPSWRCDIEREIDLIEEIARLTGYDKVPVIMPEIPAVENSLLNSFEQEFMTITRLRTLLGDSGLREVINFSFDSEELNKKLGIDTSLAPVLKNPMDSNQGILRPALLSSLMTSLMSNGRFQNHDLGLFEIGKVFSSSGNETSEEMKLGILLSGLRTGKDGLHEEAAWDFFDIKGFCELILEQFPLDDIIWRPCEKPYLRKGRSAEILSKGIVLGWLGELNLGVLGSLDIKTSVLAAEISLAVPLIKGLNRKIFKPLDRFQQVRRDISLIIPAGIDFHTVKVFLTGHPAVETAGLVDNYSGDKIPSGHSCLTFTVTLKNNQEKALTDEEINSSMSDIVAKLGTEMGIKLR
jgi:phenylalanyl-tRNA synthetase beta chain